MSRPVVVVESIDAVRILRLDAPERRNALDRAMLDELRSAIAEIAADGEARALVVTGNGRAFCAGADLIDVFGDVDRSVNELRDHLKAVYGSFLGLRDLTIPTIAAVNGAAIGAGLNIALACDIVVAGPHAAFGPTFAEIGLHPGGGCTYLMTERLGAGRALAAILSGALIKADEALRTGLAEMVAEDAVQQAVDLANHYAGRDRRLTASIKRSVRIASSSDLATSVEFESWAQAASIRDVAFSRHFSGLIDNS